MALKTDQIELALQDFEIVENMGLTIQQYIDEVREYPEDFHFSAEELEYVRANRTILANVSDCLDCSPAGEPC